MVCYLADKMSGKVGLGLRWPFVETVQFMYSRFKIKSSPGTHDLIQLIRFALLPQ